MSMTMTGVKIELNADRTLGKIEKLTAAAQGRVLWAALSDSNVFCRRQTGKLMASGKISAGENALVWTADYARRVYYTGAVSKKVNPNASHMWAHRAARLYGGNRWLALVKKAMAM